MDQMMAHMMGGGNQKSPEVVMKKINEGETAKKRGNEEFAKAFSSYHTALLCTKGITPEDPKLLKAVQTFEGAVHNNFAAAYLRSEKFEKAEKSARNCLEIQKSNAKAMYRLGVALLHLKKVDEAYEWLSKAQSKVPQDKSISQALQMARKEIAVQEKNQQKFYQGMFKNNTAGAANGDTA